MWQQMPHPVNTCYFSCRYHQVQHAFLPQSQSKPSGYWWTTNWTKLFIVCTRHVAPSTQRAYMERKRQYLDFCLQAGASHHPMPADEQASLWHFKKWKVRLLAVSHSQISKGLRDPKVSAMPHIELVVRGLKRDQVSIPDTYRSSDLGKDFGRSIVTGIIQCMCLCFFCFWRSSNRE